ncbi:MAG: ABC transporter ATP-binding protein [Proteobacteria bacterium]|nr:ABC transporter ATP-binding protein [Pseudomonadota bacterium]
MADPLIIFDCVSRYYRVGDEAVKALDKVSLRLDVGEFVSVVGPSGSGKSTFMNLCGCLDTPTSGRVMIDGVDMAGMNDDQAAELRNAKLGFVFQQFNLLPRTSALDNVALPLLYAGCNRRARHQAAAQALDQVGLGDRVKHQPSQLSGGQQQRVAIARALVNKPILLLADEPTGALDTSTGAEIMALFQDLNDSGISIILVTHEAEVAEAAKRRLAFRDGKLLHDEALKQVRINHQETRIV